MHVISRKMLRQFWEQHPDSESALARWFKIMQRHDFTSFETLRATFPTADKVGDFLVFKIGGKKNRAITTNHFKPRTNDIFQVCSTHDDVRGTWILSAHC